MKTKEISLQDIKNSLEPVFLKNSVSKASLFGSFARGDHTPDSDIDILVDFSEKASLLDMSGLSEDIRETTGLDVDIITTRCLMREPKGFIDNVMRDARIIYEVN